jgi:hypothetical protein
LNPRYHQIDLQENDLIYTFTDDYADQFDGPTSKKFKYKQFSELIVSVYTLALAEQLKAIK